MINISEILSLKNLKVTGGDLDKIKGFSSCSIDSRSIKKNEIFVAIKGENTDGHNYINQVFERGVKAAIVNNSWLKKNNALKGKILFSVSDTIKSLGELALIHKRKYQTPVFCIGGSNGKTSTKDLTAHILKGKYNLLSTKGNLNNHLGLPLTLLNLNLKHNLCLLEVGSNHFNEIQYLCDIAEPDYGLVTNIGREHLEFFKNLDGVAKEEFVLYDYIIKTNGLCFANFDDEYIKKYFKNKVCFSYSYTEKTDVQGIFKGYTKSFEPIINIRYKNKSFRVVIPTFGKQSVYNGLAAISSALFFGMSPEEIIERLKSYKPGVSQRMEVMNINGMMIVNDTYNSNPDSVRLGLETMKEYKTKGNKHIVLADMLEMGSKSTSEHKAIGVLINELGFKNLYTYGKASYNIFKSADSVENNYHFNDKDELSEFLKRVIKKGDIIYLKASRGMKLEDVINKLLKNNIEKCYTI